MDVGGDVAVLVEEKPGWPDRSDDIASQKGKAPEHAPPEEGDYCRICRGEGSEEEPLFYPCKCSGSIKFVHQACLMEWLSHSQKKYCELCKTPFRFTKLYDPHMPRRLPTPIFMRQVIIHSVQGAFSWLRVLLVAVVWLAWLPWSMRQVWRVLFYLMDCRWSDQYAASEAHSYERLQNFTLPSQTQSNLTTTINHGIGNMTLKEGIIKTLPGILSSFTGFFVSNPPFLVLRIAQAVFPRFYRWTQSVSAEYATNTVEDGQYQPLVLHRDTVLGDVLTLKTLTRSPTINNTVIDILEGQITCLSLVVVSILLFLIREWVINQQPGNGQNNENAGQPIEAQPIAAVAEVDAGQDATPAGQAPAAAGEVPVANGLEIPDSIAGPGDLETQRHSQVQEGQAQTEDDVTMPHDQEVAESSEGSSTVVRPSLTGRNAMINATSIRRSIEEQSTSNSAWPGLETFKELWERAEANPAKVIEIIEQEDRDDELGWIVSQMERLQRESQRDGNSEDDSLDRDSGQQNPVIDSHHDVRSRQASQSSDSLSELRVFGPPDVSNTDIASNSAHPHPGPRDTAEANLGFPLQEDSALGHASFDPAAYPDDLQEQLSAALDRLERVHEAQPRSVVDRMTEWLWVNELYEANDESDQDSTNTDDEHIIEDIAREAPFVPVHGQQARLEEQQDGQPREGDLPRDPEVEAAAAEAGIDINNMEAADDLEDLDGILELIGLNGPITGLIQNVIFSQFLISLTLLAGIAIPYVWGMLALDIMSNPVGVFIWLPINLAMTAINIVVDTALFVTGLVLSAFLSIVSMMHKFWMAALPSLARGIDVSDWMNQCLTLVSKSGARLEKTLLWLLVGDGISLPKINMDAQKSLHRMESFICDCFSKLVNLVTSCLPQTMENMEGLTESSMAHPQIMGNTRTQQGRAVLKQASKLPQLFSQALASFVTRESDTPITADDMKIDNAAWTARDRAFTIMLGYCSVIFLGIMYLQISRLVLRLKAGEKVPGMVADVAVQAGGVLKVILIIGIEMIVFPFYCGLLLDLALLPLFSGATVQTRFDFFFESPFTALFVHWFIGTCYMFHFALFVSMCRKIMRKGVLYFIRDPEDPTFHPVRDVLERNVTTQLSKIMFSAFIYGGLVMVCLGGVVWALSCIGGILPLHWSSGGPSLEFPYDFLFYSFILPSLLRFLQPSKKLDIAYKWWFRKVARGLRLSDFLFGEKFEDERRSYFHRTWRALLLGSQAERLRQGAHTWRDGRYVRTPASDSVRIPKGRRVFIDVNEKNERIDGQPDKDDGPYGRKNDQYTMVYVPPWFRMRIAVFIMHVWLFTALLGVCMTIVPLAAGRAIVRWNSPATSEINDIYAFTVGISFGLGISCFSLFTYQKSSILRVEKLKQVLTTEVMTTMLRTSKLFLGLLYLASYTFVFLPLALSILAELYIFTPLHTYLRSLQTSPSDPPSPSSLLHDPSATGSTHTIYLVQSWVFGMLLLSLTHSILMTSPNDRSLLSTALKSIVSGSNRTFLNPNITLGTRALVIPTALLFLVLFTLPLLLGYIINHTPHFITQHPIVHANIYQYSYPGCAAMAGISYVLVILQRTVEGWKARIKDEVYLVGERLHNFGERATGGRKDRKGKGKEKERVREREREGRNLANGGGGGAAAGAAENEAFVA